jgi:hypothetical protein
VSREITLSNAFRELIVDRSEIKSLLAEVETDSGDWDDRGNKDAGWPRQRIRELLKGRFRECDGLWPVIAEHFLMCDGENRWVSILTESLTESARRVLRAVATRFLAFVTPLRDGTQIARGHSSDGQLVPLTSGIWIDPHFQIDFLEGSVGRSDEYYEPLWSGVVLTPAKITHVSEYVTKPRAHPAEQRIEMAVKAIWSKSHALNGISMKERHRTIDNWLKDKDKDKDDAMKPVSLSSVKRYFAKHSHT